MMNEKTQARKRRAARARIKISELGVHRLTVHRTPQHIYAQVLVPSGSEVLACASTLDKSIRGSVKHAGNVVAAKLVGKLIAERAGKIGVKAVAFDRAGFKYHGRVEALADSAREHGLQF